MIVLKIVKRAKWYQFNDVVTLNARTTMSVTTTTYGMYYSAVVSRYNIKKGESVTVKMPKGMQLQVGDNVAGTLLFRHHQDRFTKVYT